VIKIFIRADGNSEIGLGHLVRCFALADMLKASFQISFVCRDIPMNLTEELRAHDFIVHKIESETELLNIISVDDIVVLDGYGFDISYQKQVKATGAKLVCIDDVADREFVADLIINHAPGIHPEDYLALENTQFALGPQYALLRPAFLKKRKKQLRQNKNIETVLICFGGSDYKNITKEVLEVAASFQKFKKINIVTGGAYSYLESLMPVIKNDERVHHFNNINDVALVEMMNDADLIIVPASGILLEALLTDAVVISGIYADNQRLMYRGFVENKSIIPAETFEKKRMKQILKEITQLDIERKPHIDSNSKNRINEKFNFLIYGK